MKEVYVNFTSESDARPSRGSSAAACYDLSATKDFSIAPGEIVRVQTGMRFQFPADHVMLVFPRSSLHRLGNGCHLANGVGIIDSDYRGEILLLVKNPLGTQMAYIQRAQRVAQFFIMPLPELVFNLSELEPSVRGSGGIGSTGA